jgi:hypothetical protein
MTDSPGFLIAEEFKLSKSKRHGNIKEMNGDGDAGSYI